MTTTIEKTYQPETIEQQWYQTWENAGYFTPQGNGTPYCIMLPPPNVTGSLHMGHGFGFTLMDVVIRYHRMCGDKTLWQPGTDHASIATQMVVERQLNALGQSRHDLGRDAFLEKVWAWKEESGNTITRQLRRLGASLDWSRERFSMDPILTKAVNAAFVELYEAGLIYRGERLVNWDPQMQTAISDLEVINEEAEGKLWHIRYLLTEGEGYLVVATTRPETLLGDVAVAVHPTDERYQHLIGKTLRLPLTDRTIPIIADEYVDPAFGTGCVKITPAHDFNDYAIGARHHLKPINIFTPNAHLNHEVPEIYRGMERFKAREQILQDLTTADLIEKIENHQLKIPRGEKSGAIIEPYLTQQWFIKMKPLAAPAIQAVENGDIRFIPENWNKTYFQWMHNIEDWCISRQLWWGHRIPIWYDETGQCYVGLDEADVRARNHLPNTSKLTQDNDVLDTWFSAGLWPFATLGWPEKTVDLSTFFPTNVLMTGFDIIFFWVARMIFFSLKFTGQVPFHEVYITGLIRDAEGQKMSKTKGNVLDPIDLIDGIDLPALIKKRTFGLMQASMHKKIEATTAKEFPDGITSYGTDALRFTFCSLASYTREIRFDTNRLGGYRHFCNKLWNASRYVSMQFPLTTSADKLLRGGMQPSTIDQWILSRLQKTLRAAHEALAHYRFDLLAQTLYDFTWNEFCDWYLELSKPVLTDQAIATDLQNNTKSTLASVLETLLRALHPIIPFITEEIWQRIAPLANKSGATIMLAPYPIVDDTYVNEEAESSIAWLKNIITAIRNLRSEMNIAPGKPLTILLRKGNTKDQHYLILHEKLLLNLGKIDTLSWLTPNETPPQAASAFIGELEIFVPLAGLINLAEEKARLQKEITKLEKELLMIQTKLANPQFVERAPAAVIDKEREKLKEAQMTMDKLKSQLTQF